MQLGRKKNIYIDISRMSIYFMRKERNKKYVLCLEVVRGM